MEMKLSREIGRRSLLADRTPFPEHSDEPIDVGHTIQLVLVHDLVEIYAGDTPLYGDGSDQREREVAAAEKLFPLLPRGWSRRS